MCEPLMAALAPLFAGGAGAGAATGLGSVLSLVGLGISGVAQVQQSRVQAQNFETQAALSERQAAIERQRGSLEADRVRDQARRLAGQQVANFAASGVQIDGSAGNIIDDSAAEAALDVSTILAGSELQAENELFEARINRTNAQRTRSSAPFFAIAPIIKGASRINWGGLYAQSS